MGREGLLLTVSPSASPFSSTSPLRRLLVSDASPRAAAARLASPPPTSRRVATATPTSPARLGTMNPLALARQLQLQILQPVGHLGGGGNFTRGIVSESACGGRPAAPREELVTDPLAGALARPLSPLPPPPPPSEGASSRAFTHTLEGIYPHTRVLQGVGLWVIWGSVALGSMASFNLLIIFAQALALHAEDMLMMKKHPDEALQLLEWALSISEIPFRLAPFVVLDSIVRIRLKQASFYCTCSPPQPARVRDYLDKAAAKCEESKHKLINSNNMPANMLKHFLENILFWSLLDTTGVIVRSKPTNHSDPRTAFRQLEVIEYMEGVYRYLGYLDGESNRGSAPTQPLKCLEQAAAKHAEALRVSILNHNSDNAAQSMKELDCILRDFLVPSLKTQGFREGRFISDHRKSIHTITSICESALKNYMQNDSDYHGPDHRLLAFNLYTMLSCTFANLALSDRSFFLPGRRSEYFKKARTNAELAVATNVQEAGKTGVAGVKRLAAAKELERLNGILRAGITSIKLFIAYYVWKISLP
jgi:hypothetical protein